MKNIFLKALEERNDGLALSILKNKSFDRYFLNENKSLLYWSIYYGCDKVVNTLLEDEKMVQLSEGENLFSAPNCQVLRGPNFLPFAISYTMILDRLLQTENIDFSKISEACTYYILERQSQKKYVPFIPFEEKLRPEHSKYILDFYTKVIENLLSKICSSDCEMPTIIDSDDKSLLYYVTKYGTDVEFDMIMKSKLDINMQFEQDAKNNWVYYGDNMMREWLLENPLTIALGCDDHLGYYTAKKERMNFRRFSTLVFDKRLDSKYVLEAINRICYGEFPLKETLILKILASRDWSNEEIYDKTLLSFAFYGLNKAYRFLLSNPNVSIRTITLELIHEYARRFHKGEPGDVDCCDIKKSEKQEQDIEEVTMQLLITRKDRISEKEMLPYDLIIFNFCCSWSEEFYNNLLEKFENSDLALKIAMDSCFEISEVKTPLRISENFILYSYRIDHIDKFILQDNEQNRELVSWAKNYTDRLIQEAGYLSSSSEKGKVKEKTVTTS